MSQTSSLNPVGSDERIHSLDALRGFAIFGILVINIRVFTGYSYFMDDVKSQLLLSEWNALFDWIHSVFFAGKFYTLFSLLFGVGFAIQFIRASSTDRSFILHFSRRLFILLIIGVVHLWGIWFSDILVIYALCGYLLLFFKELSDRALLVIAFVVLGLSGVHAWYIHVADGGYANSIYMLLTESWNSADLPKGSADSETFQMRDLVAVIQSESWETVLSFNYIGPLLRGYMISLDARIIKVLGVFLVGLWFGRQLMLRKIHENGPLLKKFLFWGLLIGLPLNIFFAMGNPTDMSNSEVYLLKDILEPFGILALTTAYVSAFMLMYLTGFKRVLELLFNSVGKTALTNYILQSIIGIILFYNAGFGLGEKLGSAALSVAVVLIFLFQVVISNLWLNFFRYGPLEWGWRVLTYGKYIKMMKHESD